MDTGDLVQEYDYHLAAVNTITFVDEGRRFVSTSDDKTIRVWEYGIPVQIKYIADPGMHSIPAITMHPNNQYFIGQSMDNQIVTYSARDKFRQNRKKVFKVTLPPDACTFKIISWSRILIDRIWQELKLTEAGLVMAWKLLAQTV